MSTKSFKIFIVLVISSFNPNISFSGDLTLGKELASTICSTCHGLDGRATTGGNSAITPNITAQQKNYLIAKLKDYKSLKIDHPQMSIIAQMLSDENMENVSEWYSSIKVEIKLPE